MDCEPGNGSATAAAAEPLAADVVLATSMGDTAAEIDTYLEKADGLKRAFCNVAEKLLKEQLEEFCSNPDENITVHFAEDQSNITIYTGEFMLGLIWNKEIGGTDLLIANAKKNPLGKVTNRPGQLDGYFGTELINFAVVCYINNTAIKKILACIFKFVYDIRKNDHLPDWFKNVFDLYNVKPSPGINVKVSHSGGITKGFNLSF